MIFLFFVTFSFHTKKNFSLLHKIIECNRPNTYKRDDGECSCLPSHPFGDPDSFEGCFNCNTPCHKYAECISPDKCKCKPSFNGDGIISCLPIFPLPVSASPNFSYVYGGCQINITLQSETNTSQIFCRFGNTIVSGAMMSNHVVMCVAPFGAIGNVELRVSNNSNDWNLPGITFEYRYSHLTGIGNILSEIVIICIIALVIFLTVMVFRDKKSESSHDDLQPLNITIPVSVYEHTDMSMQGFFPL
ncbi:hypothetical protein TRFO_12499 [Tritrichomonas foetus]|uniref:IPT/TIG domain-containing protein n=1 Tax=Tritrichomonas foetus TaxID=1144522 RepID=A0A1J4L1L9_9EUKA|nr:hypothetical protein TRFO_12499 [Tritrichomonas foetus]|eukprot:OHT17331.1 hypothetical protein TRFO_12499 [Tritrichomonas foetus]